MPTGQQYATNVPQTFITGQINPTATMMSVNSSSGWPATPFTAILEIGSSLQEPIDVTNVTGTTWTIVRAIDGTAGFTHQVNATVTHGDIGRDFREARTHIDASTGVHGISGGSSVVGTTDTQTLSNKTLASPSFSGTVGSAVTMGGSAWTGTGTLSEAGLITTSISPLTGTNRIVGQSNNGPPSSGTWSVGDIVFDNTLVGNWMCVSAGTPGTWNWMGASANITVTANGVSSVTANIPTAFGVAFQNIYIDYVAHVANNSVGPGYDSFGIRFNGISASNYNYSYEQSAIGSSLTSSTGQSQNNIQAGIAWSSFLSNNGSGRGYIGVPYFSETTFLKQAVFQGTASDGGSVGSAISGGGSLGNGHTEAITSITFIAGSNFVNSSFRLAFT